MGILGFFRSTRMSSSVFPASTSYNGLGMAPLADRWYTAFLEGRLIFFFNNWVLSTNHRKISVLYFWFVIITGITGAVLATLIRIELAYPGRGIFFNNAEKYLTTISLHGVVMVFFVVIPLIFGAFANFLIPTQLGIRDVAFPRLNSFMFWVTPPGFVLVIHILLFDRGPVMFTSGVGSSNTPSVHRPFEGRSVLGRSSLPGSGFVESVGGRILCSGCIGDPDTEEAFLDRMVENNRSSFERAREVFDEFGLRGFFFRETGFSLLSHTREEVLHFPRCGARYSRVPTSVGWSREASMVGVKASTPSWPRGPISEMLGPMVVKVSSWNPGNLIPGWAFITPYSSRLKFSALGKVDVALVAVFSAGLGSVLSAVNYILTYRYFGSPSTKNRREVRSFFVDALLVGSRMMVFANPALLIAILLLLSDRHLGTSVFDFSGGGDTILFQHLFWFFGHPEVYIIIIPCFGFVNSILPYYLRKRLSGRLSLQYSMYTIAFMGFAVWGHHMYMVGLANGVRTLYSTMTVMISVPASTKILHWCVTLTQVAWFGDVTLLFLIAFIYFFILGGLSGMFLAHIGFDVIFHDTFYVIGHFHVMLAGSTMSCLFAAFYYYFSSIFGFRYSRFFAYAHFIFYFSGQVITLAPMFWLGYAGMPRRVLDYPSVFGGWHSVASAGHLLTMMSLVFFILMIVDSIYENRAPISRTLGVGRVNTRLFSITYSKRKISRSRQHGLVLPRPLSSPSAPARSTPDSGLELDGYDSSLRKTAPLRRIL